MSVNLFGHVFTHEYTHTHTHAQPLPHWDYAWSIHHTGIKECACVRVFAVLGVCRAGSTHMGKMPAIETKRLFVGRRRPIRIGMPVFASMRRACTGACVSLIGRHFLIQIWPVHSQTDMYTLSRTKNPPHTNHINTNRSQTMQYNRSFETNTNIVQFL